MRLAIAAVGRLKGAGPEAALVDDYARRLGKLGRGVALGPLSIEEVEGRDRAAEGAALLDLHGAHADGVLIALDQRGTAPTSERFAAQLAEWRDEGHRVARFCIGGADGHAEALIERSQWLLGFGPMVWPHRLVRAMLAEQLYRAVSIVANHPYHRA